MRRAFNTRPSEFYAKLVGIYPASYRQKYGQPMVQTFDDMLEAEPSSLGKFLIWTRTLWDLPSSALKEHLTNGKGMNMSRNMKLFLAGIAIALLLANGASYWFGVLQARQGIGIERVTPTQLADAMEHDAFYSQYANSAFLFTGQVTAVQQSGVTTATFKTDHSYSVQCQFSNTELAVGDTISVAAAGGNAVRLPHGVLLHNCLKN
ncbi:MAG TPA: hypothetical protein VNG90_01660 [Candidatus Acidoferrum sp.]|nr:hypothetical protein [Candidatus Acidoferrum sp.]